MLLLYASITAWTLILAVVVNDQAPILQASQYDSIIEFIGESGQFQFCPTGECSVSSISVKLVRLQELNADGSMHRENFVPSFEDQRFGVLSCTRCTQTTFSHHLSIGIIIHQRHHRQSYKHRHLNIENCLHTHDCTCCREEH